MKQEAFLKRVGKDPSVLACSVCDEQFHTSAIGPLHSVRHFTKHVKDKHPDAVVKRDTESALSILRKSGPE